MLLNTVFGVGLLVTLLVCAWFSYFVVDITLSKGVYTTKNAVELLHKENVDAWNAFRRVNPDWRPVLRDIDLSEKSLQDVDLRSADLRGAKFTNANLDGADFTGADVRNISFSHTSLRRAAFDDEAIIKSDLTSCDITGATFDGAEMVGRVEILKAAKPIEESTTISSNDIPDPSHLAELSPHKFEEYVADIFKKLGYGVEMQGGKADYGADLVLTRDTPMGPVKEIVQLKRVSKQGRLISSTTLQALQEAVEFHSAQNGALVTNGQFARGAVAFANATNLRLIDGNALVELARKSEEKSPSDGKSISPQFD